MNGTPMTFKEGWEGLYGILSIHEINSADIIQVEDTTSKDTFERLVGIEQTRRKTINEVRKILDKDGNININPIVTIAEPNIGEELLLDEFQRYLDSTFDEERENIEKSELIEAYRELRRKTQRILLCYNGNTRLEAHQQLGRKIKTYIVASESELSLIPEYEKIFIQEYDYTFTYFKLLQDILTRTIRSKKVDTFKFQRRSKS